MVGKFSDSGLMPSGSSKAWPAVVDGKLWVPPDDHVLDHIVRQYLLVDDELSKFESNWESSEAGTVALLYDELPDCDLCRQESRGEVTARYDSRIGPEGSAWGNLCGDCYVLHSPQLLGIGLGQYLMLAEEINDDLEIAFERAREYWRARGANVPPHSPFSEE